jgi:hypothetical protein
MARLSSDDVKREERKDAFTLRPLAPIVAAIKQLAREDQIASERAMGAYCLRAGVALYALLNKNHAGLSDEDIEAILTPFLVPLVRFLQERGLLALALGTSTAASGQEREAAAKEQGGVVDEHLDTMSRAADDLADFLDV